MMKLFPVIALAFFVSALFSCSGEAPVRPSFDGVAGIKYIEVRRAYETGSMIGKSGFQQKPEWVLVFLKKDRARIWSPYEKRFIEYPIIYDHDSIFNFAREWFRLKKVSKDSMILQLLEVQSNREIIEEQSNVYMKFYSEKYLADVLHVDPAKLMLPNHFDTLYVQRRSDTANRYPDSLKYAWAATSPVQFSSRSPYVRVKKIEPETTVLDDPNPADTYLKPEYQVRISGAFKDFNYHYVATVDHQGKIHTINSLDPAENMENRLKNIAAVNTFYLERFLEIRPGTTLGIPHTSKIVLQVKGER